MDELDTNILPKTDLDAHLRRLRQMKPATDPAILAKATTRAIAVAPAFCELAHAFANAVDAYRSNGYSAGEAIRAIHEQMIEPVIEIPIIDTFA